MKDFTVIMAALIVAALVVFAYVLRKNNLLNAPVVLSILVSSVVMSFGIPYVMSAIIDTGLNPALVLIIVITICMVLTFMMSVFLSVFINEGAHVNVQSNIDEQGILAKNVDRGNIIDKISIENSKQIALEGCYMKVDISHKLDNEQAGVEGLEACVHEANEAAECGGEQDDVQADCGSKGEGDMPEEQPTAEPTQIEEYINEAFRLKGEGDFESAVLYYMYALDKKPEHDAALWIIADICALYKELGQSVLAGQMLESYACYCEGEAGMALKAGIKRNLLGA